MAYRVYAGEFLAAISRVASEKNCPGSGFMIHSWPGATSTAEKRLKLET